MLIQMSTSIYLLSILVINVTLSNSFSTFGMKNSMKNSMKGSIKDSIGLGLGARVRVKVRVRIVFLT
jgi:hypothetical protein